MVALLSDEELPPRLQRELSISPKKPKKESAGEPKDWETENEDGECEDNGKSFEEDPSPDQEEPNNSDMDESTSEVEIDEEEPPEVAAEAEVLGLEHGVFIGEYFEMIYFDNYMIMGA